MAAKHTHSPLSSPELAFWKRAYLAAELSVLLKQGASLSGQGAAHLAADFADASINELRLRQTGERK